MLTPLPEKSEHKLTLRLHSSDRKILRRSDFTGLVPANADWRTSGSRSLKTRWLPPSSI
jgi:hypothetical protein